MTREIQGPLELREEMENLSVRIYRELKNILECTKLDPAVISDGIRIKTPMGALFVISCPYYGTSIMKCAMSYRLNLQIEK